jgi:hypothetical protein
VAGGDWFAEQGEPGGAVVPIEEGYNPVADAEAKRLRPDYVSAYGGTLGGAVGGGSGSKMGAALYGGGLGGGGSAAGGAIKGMFGGGGNGTLNHPGEQFSRPDIVRNPQQGGGQQQVSDAAVQDILHKYPATNDGMRAAMAEIDRTFGAGTIKLLDHPHRLDKLVMPDGRTIDAMVGAGAPGASWGWMVEGAGHGGAGGAGGGTLGGLSGVGISPEGRAFADMVMQSRGAVGPLLGDPMAGKPITDDPSYGFRLDEGVKALERSAAAKGTLLTGGHVKALQRYGQDMASTEYQNSYARRASEQGNNYNRLAGLANFMSGEQQNQFGRLYQTAGLGLNATNQAQNNASGYASNIGNTQIGVGNVQGAATQAGAAANADTIGTLGAVAGDLAGKWYANRSARGAGNPNMFPGTSIPYGTGL